MRARPSKKCIPQIIRKTKRTETKKKRMKRSQHSQWKSTAVDDVTVTARVRECGRKTDATTHMRATLMMISVGMSPRRPGVSRSPHAKALERVRTARTARQTVRGACVCVYVDVLCTKSGIASNINDMLAHKQSAHALRTQAHTADERTTGMNWRPSTIRAQKQKLSALRAPHSHRCRRHPPSSDGATEMTTTRQTARSRPRSLLLDRASATQNAHKRALVQYIFQP